MTRLLCTGDQHIGAGADLGRTPGERLREQEAVWDWTLAQARALDVDAILHAGDVFQHRKPDPESLLAFERPLVRHRDQGGPRVLLIPGNHCLSSLDQGCALDVFHEAGLVELVRSPRVVLVDGGARVACLPWAPTSRLAANFDGPRDELNAYAASLLVDAARDLYASMDDMPGRGRLAKVLNSPKILLTHFHVTGTSLPSGVNLHQPVLSGDELLGIGYDAVIAGHLHVPEVFGGTGLSVGSPMPLNFGEADGRIRGPWIVTLGEPETAKGSTRPRHASGSPSVTFEQLEAPSRGFLTVDVDANEETDLSLLPVLPDGFVKVRLHGTDERLRALDLNALRRDLEAHGAHRVFVELDVERAARARDRTVTDSMDEREALARWFSQQNGRVDHETAERALLRAAAYFEAVSS